MPTLFRFLRLLLILGGLGLAALYALATLVPPMTREMREPLPRSFIDRPADAAARP